MQTQSGQVIGWVPRQKTPQVGAWIDSRHLAVANVTSRGKAQGKDLVGVNIDIMLVSEEDRPWMEAKIKRLRRQLTPNLGKGLKPQIRVVEDDGFGIGVWVLCALFVIFMACGLVVMGGVTSN